MRQKTINQAVSAKVRAILAERRLTGVWLARQIGMPKSTLARRLAGEQPFTADELVRIAEILGVEPSDLLRGDYPAQRLSA